jgi:GntR family transcriptional regulator / MocR family aminotransferase
VLVPALRLGFLVAPASLQRELTAAKALTDWHGAAENQGALAELIEDGLLARQIRRLVRAYAERRDRLVAALERELGGELALQPASAGLHVAALFRDARRDPDRIARRALAEDVAVQSLAPYYHGRGRRRPGLALGYGSIAAARIDEGVRRLARAFGP